MSLAIDSWLNYARSLWQREAITKLAEHEETRDENGDLIVPVPNPHTQYFHLILDSAWAGMRINSGAAFSPGDVLLPWNIDIYPPFRLATSLAAGAILVPQNEGGGYQINFYFTFSAASNGGDFMFRILLDNAETDLVSVANLSNQSDVGNGVIVVFIPIYGAQPHSLTVRFEPESTKDITILDATWTINRQFPDYTLDNT